MGGADGCLSGSCLQGVCTEAGMYALRERRVHVTQEDFEMAVAKVGQVTLFLIFICSRLPQLVFTCFRADGFL